MIQPDTLTTLLITVSLATALALYGIYHLIKIILKWKS